MYCIHSLLVFCAFLLSFLLMAPLSFSAPPDNSAKQSAHAFQWIDAERLNQSTLLTQARAFFDRWPRRDKALLSSAAKRQGSSAGSSAGDPTRAPARIAITAERSLDDVVVAHFESVSVNALIEYLAPANWSIHFDIGSERLKQQVVFHAETSRRKALDSLLSQVGLQGIFYPQSRTIVIAQGSAS